MFMRIIWLVARTMRSGMKLRSVPTTCVRSDLEHRLVDGVIHLSQRCRRVEPLRILLVAVEDERRTDEAAGDEVAHVAHGRAVAEGQPHLGLESLLPREIPSAKRVAVVVGDRLLAEHVLAGLERRPGQLEMRVAGGADVNEVDVVALEQLARIGGCSRDVELVRRRAGAVHLDVGNRHDAAARLPSVPWQVGAARPGTGAEHAYSDDTIGAHTTPLDGRECGRSVRSGPQRRTSNGESASWQRL
jgi:hypothetical protein